MAMQRRRSHEYLIHLNVVAVDRVMVGLGGRCARWPPLTAGELVLLLLSDEVSRARDARCGQSRASEPARRERDETRRDEMSSGSHG